MTKARLTSDALLTGRRHAALEYPEGAVELDVTPGEGGTVEAEGVCKRCAKAAASGEYTGLSVIEAPTGMPHYEDEPGHTLCGRDSSEW